MGLGVVPPYRWCSLVSQHGLSPRYLVLHVQLWNLPSLFPNNKPYVTFLFALHLCHQKSIWMSLIYLHKNLHSCSRKQPGVLWSFMSINYAKQSKSHNYIIRGSSKLLPSVSLSKAKRVITVLFPLQSRVKMLLQRPGRQALPKAASCSYCYYHE